MNTTRALYFIAKLNKSTLLTHPREIHMGASLHVDVAALQAAAYGHDADNLPQKPFDDLMAELSKMDPIYAKVVDVFCVKRRGAQLFTCLELDTAAFLPYKRTIMEWDGLLDAGLWVDLYGDEQDFNVTMEEGDGLEFHLGYYEGLIGATLLFDSFEFVWRDIHVN